MNRVLVGNGGLGAQCLPFHHARAPMSVVLFAPSVPHVRLYTQFDPLSCKPRRPSSTWLCSSASSLVTTSSTTAASATVAIDSGASAATAAAASSATKRTGFAGWYLAKIETNPIMTKSITAAIIFAAADVCSQLGEHTSRRLDLVRTLRMACYGMIVLGPALHCWFNFISFILPKRDMASTLMKMALGQTTFGPFMTCVFFSTNALVQGESASEIIARLRRDLLPTMIRGLSYWPLCDFITFRFVPVDLQPLICNWFSFFWTIYLTYMASKKKVDVPKNSTS